MRAADDQVRRVLVVDDVADMVDTLSMLLQLDGHVVATAHDGPSAIHRATVFQPDVVLLDLELPEVSGLVVARRLRERMGTGPLIIAVSGWPAHKLEQRAREAGCDHYVVKPFDFDEIKKLLRAQHQR